MTDMQLICEFILWETTLTPDEVEHLPRAFREHYETAAEKAWEARQAALMETGGPDDSNYRATMEAAGRGHQLR